MFLDLHLIMFAGSYWLNCIIEVLLCQLLEKDAVTFIIIVEKTVQFHVDIKIFTCYHKRAACEESGAFLTKTKETGNKQTNQKGDRPRKGIFNGRKRNETSGKQNGRDAH